MQLRQQLFRFPSVGRKVRGQNVHVVAVADGFFLLLNLHCVEVGNFSLYHFDGVALIHRLNMEIDDNAGIRIEKVRQHTVVEFRREDLQERYRAQLAAHLKRPAVFERKRGRGDKILCGKSAGCKPFPFKTEFLPVGVHDSVKQLQTSLAVQRPRPCAHDLEIVEQIGFNAGKPCPRRPDTVCLHRKGQVLGFHIPVVAAFKLPFEDAGVFLPDRV